MDELFACRYWYSAGLYVAMPICDGITAYGVIHGGLRQIDVSGEIWVNFGPMPATFNDAAEVSESRTVFDGGISLGSRIDLATGLSCKLEGAFDHSSGLPMV